MCCRPVCRTPPGVRELKLYSSDVLINSPGRTPPGVRELKQDTRKALSDARGGRTPPGVRELKRAWNIVYNDHLGRTPPGVRELKHADSHEEAVRKTVAPLPGCVN